MRGAAMHHFNQLFQVHNPIFAMLHLKGDTADEVFELAKKEIDIYYQEGIDALIVEDYYGSVQDVEVVLSYLNTYYPTKIYGVNILRDFNKSFELALAYQAQFVQIDSVSGHLSPDQDRLFESQLKKLRAASADRLIILGGVRFKYQPILSERSLKDDLRIAKDRCHAVVVTGDATGVQTPKQKIKEFRALLDDFPLIIGAGLTTEDLKEKMALANGAIVGSYFKHNHQDNGNVCTDHVRSFMTIIQALRDELKGDH
jgi:uncharacterized protein